MNDETQCIGEIRAARVVAEMEIMAVIARFKSMTGVGITACHLETVTFRRAEDSRPVEVPSRVVLTVEI